MKASNPAAVYDQAPRTRAAIYGRVSTQKQDYALQQHEVSAYASRMGWETAEYLEQASSKLGTKRVQLDRLLEDARLRKFDVVVVWKMDRFARSLTQLINNIQLLAQQGIRFISVTDHIDTDDKSPTGKLMLQILGAFAEFERNIIVERVRAGVEEAQRKGKHCGRPFKVFPRARAIELRKKGMSWRAIEREIGVGQSTIRAALGVCNKSPRGSRKSVKQTKD